MRRIILALTLLALTFVFVPKAFAQDLPEWIRIDDEDGSPSRMYARTEDLAAGRSNQTAAKVWLKYDYSRDRTIRARHSLNLTIINCVAMTSRVVSSTIYFPDKSNMPGIIDTHAEFIVPNSNMAYVAKLLCSDPEEDTADYR